MYGFSYFIPRLTLNVQDMLLRQLRNNYIYSTYPKRLRGRSGCRSICHNLVHSSLWLFCHNFYCIQTFLFCQLKQCRQKFLKLRNHILDFLQLSLRLTKIKIWVSVFFEIHHSYRMMAFMFPFSLCFRWGLEDCLR